MLLDANTIPTPSPPTIGLQTCTQYWDMDSSLGQDRNLDGSGQGSCLVRSWDDLRCFAKDVCRTCRNPETF